MSTRYYYLQTPLKMTYLMNLPNEVLITILELLATADLQSLILLQLTNRRLRVLVRDVIYNIQKVSSASRSSQYGIHPFLKTKFKGLFNTADCFTAMERSRRAYLSLEGDYTLPFRRLPWAQDEEQLQAHLRPEASWRDISLTFGRAPITHLDIVKSFSAPEGDSVDYYQLEMPPSGMTMGLFYDVLLCDTATYRRETGSWELIVGTRLRSYDVLSEYECFIPGDRVLVDQSKEARQAAVLYVRGAPVSRNIASETEENNWISSSQNKQRLLPWQGPVQNFIFTGYYDY
ncbi:uncharacterized protein GGS22DRAFT_153659 [Annulohypoxylon maeteangense]|uniref:uncharacterized protein n=1 Tax=Annulohypoxylon maeteangense TaxID=1927788 RepID=UPI0020074EF2|nr:uncharacterized protein GGS22DRAFT_153659 [Annulohypoxylon maeteangense]KAI0889333.1 hypothetical protein GGS22DRAFT_153659 [Annulohypoxylon maeteangense]